MGVDVKYIYLKMRIDNAEDVYIRRDDRGFTAVDIYTLQEDGWSLLGISRSAGWLYWKKPVG